VSIDTLPYSDGGCPGRRHRQIIATIPGTDLASQLFVVTAHLDAVPNTQGSDDNASGAVALVCAAKALARQSFRRTIQFVAFNAEEVGLQGSRDYVSDTFAASNFEICGAFNMDMVAWDGDADRKFQVQSNPGDASSAFMRDRLVETVGVYGLNLVPVAVCDPDDTSDHGAFWQQGKPAVLAGEEYFCETPLGSCNWEPFCQHEDFNPNWHQPSDVVGTLQLDILRETTKAIIGVTAYAAEIL
jgi:Zn-dependent M28 family amino/carboxypeptidase